MKYAGVKCPEDKPYIESFNGSYKAEEIYRNEYRGFLEARMGGERNALFTEVEMPECCHALL